MNKAIAVIGWEAILPQLAVYFAVLRRGGLQAMSPCNLFLSGGAGMNKTAGLKRLLEDLGYKVACIDCSTIEHIADLAGVVNLKANRISGKAHMILGELLSADVLILDELLNTPDHVMPQFRQLLQRLLVLLAKQHPIAVKFFVATGNLGYQMLEGQPRLLDSPTADRFSMVIAVPSIWDMQDEQDQVDILEERESSRFTDALNSAMTGIDLHYDAVSEECGNRATRYVRSLGDRVKKTPFAFEGRRGQLLRRFVLTALSLHRAQPQRDLKEMLLKIVSDCLSYHRLSGIELDFSQLKGHHEVAFQAMGDMSVDALVASEPSLDGKMNIVLRYLAVVTAVTKAAVIGQVIRTGSTTQKLALLQLAAHPIFVGQPHELRALITERMPQLMLVGDGPLLEPEALVAFSAMSQVEATAFELAGANREETDRLLAEAQACLSKWGI